MNYSYIIIDDDEESVLRTKAMASRFPELTYKGSAANLKKGLNAILEYSPEIVFLEIDPLNEKSKLSLSFINEVREYLTVLPEFVITTRKKKLAFEAIRYQVTDYLLKPVTKIDFVKLLLKLKQKDSSLFSFPTSILERLDAIELKTVQVVKEQPLILCIKSYGDYRYIDTRDITYLKADNNSTDIHLNNGEMVTAFKTLKHFEVALHYPFVRIHNSYIVNSSFISRIHTGNSTCHIKNGIGKIPFSKSFKSNVALIIDRIANDNYLEI
ncbi:LytR/AlgR family response regulator transcription factor [Flavobacterium muglaense]|uniref:Response regulator transcription factor n=1 Tax=Flavobacterium muglaense TaxID=2764716 RepID=A0A923MY43_9FLAO|nr:LytTR family DNA-binding domain-containing protein [Flavobacterium muglaense]MBC5837377.1 response regulator transcription factor [Flavobacterium muglaense]MBC5843891.1 response regulator transcription factor [Flavobacterium muglaense]